MLSKGEEVCAQVRFVLQRFECPSQVALDGVQRGKRELVHDEFSKSPFLNLACSQDSDILTLAVGASNNLDSIAMSILRNHL